MAERDIARDVREFADALPEWLRCEFIVGSGRAQSSALVALLSLRPGLMSGFQSVNAVVACSEICSAWADSGSATAEICSMGISARAEN